LLSESFSEITIGGALDLSNNQLTSLPESFVELKSKIKIKGNLLPDEDEDEDEDY